MLVLGSEAMREVKAATSLAETEGEGGSWDIGDPEAPPGEEGMRESQGIRGRALMI